MGSCAYLADLVVLVHALCVAFIVLGQAAVLVGAVLGWAWVRNFWFRTVHAALVLIVVAESLLGLACPLTSLEDWLRAQSGQVIDEGTFLGRAIHGVLFLSLPTWVFTVAYCLFGMLVAATLLWYPPRRRRCGV